MLLGRGPGSVRGRRHGHPRYVPAFADRCGTPRPRHIIPIRHDGDVPQHAHPEPSTPCSTASSRTRCGAPRHPSSTPTARAHHPRRRCCATPPPRPRTPPTGCRPRTPRSTRALRHATDLAPDLNMRTLRDVGRGAGQQPGLQGGSLPGAGAGDRARRLGRRAGPGRADRAARAASGGPCHVVAGAARTGGHAARCRPRGRRLPAGRARRAAARAGGRRGRRSSDAAVIVEPGTPRGYAAVLAARSRLTDAARTCWRRAPRTAPARSPHSKELVPASRYSWTTAHCTGGSEAAARPRGREVLVRAGITDAGDARRGRVLRHPVARKGLVRLEVCASDRTAGRIMVTQTRPRPPTVQHATPGGDASSVPGLC